MFRVSSTKAFLYYEYFIPGHTHKYICIIKKRGFVLWIKIDIGCTYYRSVKLTPRY